MRQSQHIAVIAGKRTAHERVKTEAYKRLQRAELFFGQSRQYMPFNDEDQDRLPPEEKFMATSVAKELQLFYDAFQDLVDATATVDAGNQSCCADISVDGITLAAKVPVTTLLFLEKQLTDVIALLQAIPVLDPGEQWELDPTNGTYRTPVAMTMRTKKTERPIVLYDATEKHPAQTQLITEDVNVGRWHVFKRSSAMSAIEKQRLLDRARRLLDAVKIAREEANAAEVAPVRIAGELLRYLQG